jgi:hypothetical protein
MPQRNRPGLSKAYTFRKVARIIQSAPIGAITMTDLPQENQEDTPRRRTRRVKEPVSPFIAAEPAPIPEPEPEPKPTVAEVATVKTRYSMPVFIPTQKKVLAPGILYPVIVDNWVKRQLSLPAGAVVKV